MLPEHAAAAASRQQPLACWADRRQQFYAVLERNSIYSSSLADPPSIHRSRSSWLAKLSDAETTPRTEKFQFLSISFFLYKLHCLLFYYYIPSRWIRLLFEENQDGDFAWPPTHPLRLDHDIAFRKMLESRKKSRVNFTSIGIREIRLWKTRIRKPNTNKQMNAYNTK